jgi:DNA-binding Xre family transcriptional regulator
LLADFEPISLLLNVAYLIVARKAMPANDLQGLIAWLKANPDTATEGTSGDGSAQHAVLRICGALDVTPNDLLVPDDPSRRLSAYERWLARLIASARDLDADDVKLAARQIEALAEHRATGRGR